MLPITLSSTVEEAHRALAMANQGAVVVWDKGAPVGVVLVRRRPLSEDAIERRDAATGGRDLRPSGEDPSDLLAEASPPAHCS